MRRENSILLGSLCLVVLFWSPSGLAAVANLPPAADTFINSGSPGSNAGGHAWFDAGRDGTGGVRRDDDVLTLAGGGANSDAVAADFTTTDTSATWPWEELLDQTGHSEDMSFVLFTRP